MTNKILQVCQAFLQHLDIALRAHLDEHLQGLLVGFLVFFLIALFISTDEGIAKVDQPMRYDRNQPTQSIEGEALYPEGNE